MKSPPFSPAPNLPLVRTGNAFTLPASPAIYAAVLCNAGLAMLNAAGIPQSFGAVAFTEATILAYVGGYILIGGLQPSDGSALAFMAFSVVAALCTSLANQTIYVDCVRNIMIVGLFFMMGARLAFEEISTVFCLLSILVATTLTLELLDSERYVAIFQPAAYYAKTRGIDEFVLDNSGLFRNALGFEDRFSFGLSAHRTASLFIDQVSLANFADVICIYVLSFSRKLSILAIIIYISLVILILITNDSRTSSIFSLISVVGYIVYPKLPANFSWAIMPAILMAGVATFALLGISNGDDIGGRVAVTMTNLRDFALPDFFGSKISHLPQYMDSGYAYVIASSTIIGLLFFWMFCSLVFDANTPGRRRCLFSLNLYIFANLMIGGTAVFSIKVAAPLWVIAGFMSSQTASRL